MSNDPDRELWLDVCRGIAVAGMILVNNPGSWADVYWPLTHADWHGWTPTDLIFPLFLFLVGVSIAFAFSPWVGGAKYDLYVKIARRTLVLYALGLLLAGFPTFDLQTIRVTGVLQRIAICYFFASIIFLNTQWPTQALAAATLLVGYHALMYLAPEPGYGAGCMSKECNIAGYIDRVVLGKHIGAGSYDPEGLLSTIPAIATTVCGVLAGQWLRLAGKRKVLWLVGAGVCVIIVGVTWHPWFPINKTLWTSSYVLFTVGTSSLVLALCHALVHHMRFTWRGLLPFAAFGVNAIAAFVLSELLARFVAVKEWWDLPHGDGRPGVSLQVFLYEQLFTSWATPRNASVLYAVAYLMIFLGVVMLLHWRRIRITL
jgi:predicted acyltransferase